MRELSSGTPHIAVQAIWSEQGGRLTLGPIALRDCCPRMGSLPQSLRESHPCGGGSPRPSAFPARCRLLIDKRGASAPSASRMHCPRDLRGSDPECVSSTNGLPEEIVSDRGARFRSDCFPVYLSSTDGLDAAWARQRLPIAYTRTKSEAANNFIETPQPTSRRKRHRTDPSGVTAMRSSQDNVSLRRPRSSKERGGRRTRGGVCGRRSRRGGLGCAFPLSFPLVFLCFPFPPFSSGLVRDGSSVIYMKERQPS